MVVIYLIDLMVINVESLGEGGANLPVCTDYAEFMHLKLIAQRNDYNANYLAVLEWKKKHCFNLENSLSKWHLS